MVRGSTIDAEKAKKASCDINLSIHNKFDIEVRDAATGEIKQKAEGYNVIKDAFWTYLFSATTIKNWFSAIVFGSGSGTPDASVPGLFSYSGGKATTGVSTQTFPVEGYAFRRNSITLGVSDYNGTTITEVGVSSGTSNTPSRIFTHAMLQDMNGNQISITKTDTDIITIYATIYVHWNPAGYDDGNIAMVYQQSDIGNRSHIITELLGIDSHGDTSYSCPFYSGPPSGYGDQDCVVVIPAYKSKNATNRTISYTLTRMNVSQGNVYGGLNAVRIAGAYIFAPSSGLPGSDIVAEPIGTGDGVTTKYNTRFPFVSNVEVYVDGILCPDVTIFEGLTTSNNIPSAAFKYLPNYSSDISSIPLSRWDGTWSGSAMNVSKAGVYENIYADHGVKRIYQTAGCNNGTGDIYHLCIAVSDDLVTWHDLSYGYNNGTNVPAEYAYYKYWKFWGKLTGGAEYPGSCPNIEFIEPLETTYTITFATPPAEGAVITANYHTAKVAKDSDHVFDMSMTIHVGEYTE